MIFTVALVDLPECRDTLRESGVQLLVEAGVNGLDLRLPSGTSGREWDALVDLAQWTWESGATVTVHSWEGRFDGTRATADRAEGRKDALAVVRRIKALQRAVLERWLGDLPARIAGRPPLFDPAQLESLAHVEAYRGNFERDLWRGADGFANPSADDYLDEFYLVFYEELRTCAADYLGFGNPDVHYKDSDIDRDGHQDDTIPEDLPNRVRRVALMVYQSTESDMMTVIERNLAPWGELDFAIFVGVGRLDAKQGQVGNLKALIGVLRRRLSRLVEVVFYVGFGAEGQLLVGHAGYPALVQAVPQVLEVLG